MPQRAGFFREEPKTGTRLPTQPPWQVPGSGQSRRSVNLRPWAKPARFKFKTRKYPSFKKPTFFTPPHQQAGQRAIGSRPARKYSASELRMMRNAPHQYRVPKGAKAGYYVKDRIGARPYYNPDTGKLGSYIIYKLVPVGAPPVVGRNASWSAIYNRLRWMWKHARGSRQSLGNTSTYWGYYTSLESAFEKNVKQARAQHTADKRKFLSQQAAAKARAKAKYDAWLHKLQTERREYREEYLSTYAPSSDYWWASYSYSGY